MVKLSTAGMKPSEDQRSCQLTRSKQFPHQKVRGLLWILVVEFFTCKSSCMICIVISRHLYRCEEAEENSTRCLIKRWAVRGEIFYSCRAALMWRRKWAHEHEINLSSRLEIRIFFPVFDNERLNQNGMFYKLRWLSCAIILWPGFSDVRLWSSV